MIGFLLATLLPPDAAPHEGAQPYSPRYGDVYHPASGALAQAAHVFLRGNGLPERWRGRDSFTVCETGFGLGLNFLALWQAWRTDPQRSRQLHVVSLEAHPFEATQLAQWHAGLLPAELAPLSVALRERWPWLLPGLHRLELEGGALTLTLGLGQAQVLAAELDMAVDAYFFDGFAPARNPEMWTPELIASLAAYAAPEATLATWTSAGAVRRAFAAAGFEVRKVPGFAGKREMTVGVMPAGRCGERAAKVLERRCSPARVAVVGGGVAGTGVAAAFARRGWESTIFAPPVALESERGLGHLAAALTPVAEPADGVRSRVVRAGALRARQLWGECFDLEDPTGPVWTAGTFQVLAPRLAARTEAAERWLQNMRELAWPQDWLQVMDVQEASRRVGLGVARAGVFYGQALRVRPAALTAQWAERAGVRRRQAQVVRLQPLGEQGWALFSHEGKLLGEVDRVVVATAGHVPDLLREAGLAETELGMLSQLHHVAGQISWYAANTLPGGGPSCIVAGDGYVLPAVQGYCVVGSTYDHHTPWGQQPASSEAAHQRNLEHLHALLPATAQLPVALRPAGGWAGWRAVLPDRLPAVGWLRSDLGVATAYGSRGLAWAGLAGELLAAGLTGEPQVLERSLMADLDPKRLRQTRSVEAPNRVHQGAQIASKAL